MVSWLSPRAIYHVSLVLGIFNIGFSIISLMIVYRWAVSLLLVDEKTRNEMIGQPFADWIKGADDDMILIFASIYLGIKLVFNIASTARWEISMEKSRHELVELEQQGGFKRKVKPKVKLEDKLYLKKQKKQKPKYGFQYNNPNSESNSNSLSGNYII